MDGRGVRNTRPTVPLLLLPDFNPHRKRGGGPQSGPLPTGKTVVVPPVHDPLRDPSLGPYDSGVSGRGVDGWGGRSTPRDSTTGRPVPVLSSHVLCPRGIRTESSLPPRTPRPLPKDVDSPHRPPASLPPHSRRPWETPPGLSSKQSRSLYSRGAPELPHRDPGN